MPPEEAGFTEEDDRETEDAIPCDDDEYIGTIAGREELLLRTRALELYLELDEAKGLKLELEDCTMELLVLGGGSEEDDSTT
jgi:hypothetical protein